MHSQLPTPLQAAGSGTQRLGAPLCVVMQTNPAPQVFASHSLGSDVHIDGSTHGP
jgi:hypothetical protein